MVNRKKLATMAGAVWFACGAQAALVNLGNGTVLDESTNLVWLYDWNMSGAKDWATQKTWAEDLTFAGQSDWRLPAVEELQSLGLSVFGNVGVYLGLTAHFNNVQPGDYWSGTEDALNPALAWRYYTGGAIDTHDKVDLIYAVAVRSGSVPEPNAMALTLAGLLAIGATAAMRRSILSR